MTENKIENPLAMKNIQEVMTKSPAQLYGETIGKAFTHDWVFGSWWEKLILTVSVLWSGYSIGSLIWSLF